MDGSASRWQSLLRDLEKETATLENLNPLVLWYSEADAFWHILEQTSRGEGLQKITKRSSIRSSQTIRKLCGRVASECFRRFPQELEQMNTTLRSLAPCLKLPQTASNCSPQREVANICRAREWNTGWKYSQRPENQVKGQRRCRFVATCQRRYWLWTSNLPRVHLASH